MRAVGAVGDMEERSALRAVSGSIGNGTGWLADLVIATKSADIGFGVGYVTVMDEYVIGYEMGDLFKGESKKMPSNYLRHLLKMYNAQFYRFFKTTV